MSFYNSDLLFIIRYPLPDLPPRGKEWFYLSSLGGNERGFKKKDKVKFVSKILKYYIAMGITELHGLIYFSISQSLSPSVSQSLSPSVPQSLSPSVPQSLSLSVPQGCPITNPTYEVPKSLTLILECCKLMF